MTEHPLDNAVWQALTTRQAHLALGGPKARRYPAHISPFAGLPDTSAASFEALAGLVAAGQHVVLPLAERIEAAPGFDIVHRGLVDQMVGGGEPVWSGAARCLLLGEAELEQMIALAQLTQPGPFDTGTAQLGRFAGIKMDGQLLAMAGERMCLDGYTEISAVCVHPGHRGHGYAAELVIDAAQAIRQAGRIPCLHVYSDNLGAIALYRKLGFSTRRTLHLAVLQRQ
ncbi:GNAT family N-acetyltransferase [Janthinobacterium agaricidamnosum]|uniref:Acetyltransferase family protein n=1 Tax=Janthinobacterium agaricidamnosum NBRC 102515 = DSM 9628 TaxID=1349767 RepID=W0V0J9_9BURK|nr:GNAT family N-acetyltransferase [Janthinobacterium agaricidamnosum]CDG81120.1 acetyltransferase family protein [Janthinobacterium agaricidamnosum NBRC 102515 = DSM 9628]